MNELRESHFIIKSGTHNPDLAKAKIQLKVNFGSNEYENNLNKIKELGIEPSENVFVISSEFNSEEAAQVAVTKVTNIYENILPTLGIPAVWETPKAQGKVFVATFRVPEASAEQLKMLEPIVGSLGEMTSSDQHLEFEFSGDPSFKEVFTEEENVPESGSLVKFALVTHKDLPTKITSILSGMMGPKADSLKIGGEVLASIKHIKFDIAFDQTSFLDKEATKNIMMASIQTIIMALTPLDLLDVVKTIGGTIKGTMCISPIISVDLIIYLPALIETLNTVELPNP